ncbi:MFS general substrate transporter [Exophiala viscosa]|uniref:MFS general substrate transporter n=1 Tax=Exophiala viscosa TaxID=2486360 RepID=UPI00218D008D|nr:MFS general substrate transporter [Exophiala viscosa]
MAPQVVDDDIAPTQNVDDVRYVSDIPFPKEKEGKATAAGRALIEEADIVPLTSLERKTTTKWELLCYYLYYFGNTGIGPWNYAPSQLQNVLYQAGFDPDQSPVGKVACGTGRCFLGFAGAPKPITSIVLDISGISFAIQVVVSLAIGAYADYGSWRPLICVVSSVISWGIGFAWLAVKGGAQWQTAIGLYISGYVAFNCSTSYFLAAMPGLVRDLPNVQESEQAVLEGRKNPEEHLILDMVERNRIADYAFLWTSYGPVVQLAIAAGILIALNASLNTSTNTNAINVIIAYTTGIWIVFAIPWFIKEQKRPGQQLPPGTSYLTIGFVNFWQALKEIRKLKQVMLYLAAFFILSDAENTVVTVIGTLQNSVVSYDIITLNYLTILAFGTQGTGMLVMWLIQKKYQLHTKTVLLFNVACIVVLCIWGFIGIWADHVGFKNVGEIWAYEAYFGLLVCQWYQLPYTFISDLVPRPKLFLFWSLFSISGKTSAFIGPFVTSAIIDRSGGNTNMAFAFLLPLCLIGMVMLWFVDPEMALLEAKEYLEAEASMLYKQDIPQVEKTAY